MFFNSDELLSKRVLPSLRNTQSFYLPGKDRTSNSVNNVDVILKNTYKSRNHRIWPRIASSIL